MKFWNTTSGTLKFDPNGILDFLKENGFGCYRGNDLTGFMLIRVNNGIISITNKNEIRKFCFDYLNEYPFSDESERNTVKSEYIKLKFFTNENLALIGEIDVNELKDTESTSYLTFKNCIIKVSKGQFEKLEYGQIGYNVFEKDIINHHFEFDPKMVIMSESVYWRFLEDLCHDEDIKQENLKINSLLSVIGYLVHRYKDPSRGIAIILSDFEVSDNPNGGTGKSLFARSVGFVRNTVFADGKLFNTSVRFWSSEVDYDTRLLVIDDIPRRFDFERLFPLITERIVIEKKYRDTVVSGLKTDNPCKTYIYSVIQESLFFSI